MVEALEDQVEEPTTWEGGPSLLSWPLRRSAAIPRDVGRRIYLEETLCFLSTFERL